MQASAIQLDELESKFHLQEVFDSSFFQEWQEDLPTIDDWEKQALDRLKAGYLNLQKKPLILENAVKMAMLYPLLFIAGFNLFPLQVKLEQPISLEDEDGNIIEGRLDGLVLKNQLWLLVIEAKRSSIALEAGISQLLTYMLANPNLEQHTFGLITNGNYFMFAKLIRQQGSKYAFSDIFVVRNQGNELYQVLKILKRLVL